MRFVWGFANLPWYVVIIWFLVCALLITPIIFKKFPLDEIIFPIVSEDDLNDLPVKNIVGLFITTADAATYIKNRADLVLKSKGGEGAVREFVEKLLMAKGTLGKYIKIGWLDKN